MINIEEAFEKFEDEFLKFERIESPLHTRPDICAFLLLDSLVPGKRDMVSCAEHDEIWLDVECDALAAVATEEDILTLTRCGVRYCSDTGSLAMYV